MNGKLRRAEIKEGRIWLEDKLLINPEFLGLKVLSNVREISEEDLENQKPERADSYILGEERHTVASNGVPRVYKGVLYLNSYGGKQ